MVVYKVAMKPIVYIDISQDVPAYFSKGLFAKQR